MQKSQKIKSSRLADYAGMVTSVELVEMMKKHFDAGKKVYIVVEDVVNQVKVMRNSTAPASSGPCVMAFATRKAKPRITL